MPEYAGPLPHGFEEALKLPEYWLVAPIGRHAPDSPAPGGYPCDLAACCVAVRPPLMYGPTLPTTTPAPHVPLTTFVPTALLEFVG